jgi:hypothetical protein
VVGGCLASWHFWCEVRAQAGLRRCSLASGLSVRYGMAWRFNLELTINFYDLFYSSQFPLCFYSGAECSTLSAQVRCVGVQSRLRLAKLRYAEPGLVCVDYVRSTHFTIHNSTRSTAISADVHADQRRYVL